MNIIVGTYFAGCGSGKEVVKEKQRLIGFQTPLENTEGQAKFLLQVESEFKNIWRETLDLGRNLRCCVAMLLLCSHPALTCALTRAFVPHPNARSAVMYTYK